MFKNLLVIAMLVGLAAGLTAPAPASAETTPASPSGEYIDPADMSQVPRLVRKTLVLATAKARRGEHEDAVATLAKHLQSNPDQDHALVQYHLARSHDALGNTAEARNHYALAVELEPRLAAAWFGLGHARYSLGAYREAGEAFLRSFRTDANPQPETLYFAAAGYLLAEDAETAAPLLLELCSGRWGTPRHDWYAQLAAAAISLEQPDLAAPLLERYLATDPGNHEIWYLAYQFHVGFKDYREAAIALTMVGYLRELQPREERTLGDLYSLIEVPMLASFRYRASLSEDARPEDHERLASALVAAHELDQALTSLQSTLSRYPTARIWSLLGDVHYLKRDFDSAALAYTRVADLEPDSGRAQLMIGYCYLEKGNRGLAIQHLVAAAKFEDQADLAERLLLRARRMSQT
jgi:tetratricopeptide (TPR) repeat protein